jgi:phosphonate transport system permease protein
MAMTDTGVPPPPKRSASDIFFDVLLWGGIAALLAWAFKPVEMYKTPLLFTNSKNMQDYVNGFLHLDLPHWPIYVEQMWLTIQMALWGTFLAVILAVPLGLLGARNMTPAIIQQPVRRVLDLLRAVPDLVIGTLFLVAVGIGPFAGVLAIALNTGGVLGKLFAEAVESMDPRPVEGVRATGAAPLHEMVWGVIPQVAPLWTSYALYRFESSSRSATVLGLIGAGGIGKTLFDSLQSFAYDQVAMIAIVIVLAVSAIDFLSSIIRKRLL